MDSCDVELAWEAAAAAAIAEKREKRVFQILSFNFNLKF